MKLSEAPHCSHDSIGKLVRRLIESEPDIQVTEPSRDSDSRFDVPKINRPGRDGIACVRRDVTTIQFSKPSSRDPLIFRGVET